MLIRIERIQRVHLLVRELEIVHLGVGDDAFGRVGFGQGNEAVPCELGSEVRETGRVSIFLVGYWGSGQVRSPNQHHVVALPDTSSRPSFPSLRSSMRSYGSDTADSKLPHKIRYPTPQVQRPDFKTQADLYSPKDAQHPATTKDGERSDAPPLQTPPDQHLRPRLARLLRDPDQRRVLGLCALHEGRVGLEGDIVRLAVGNDGGLLVVSGDVRCQGTTGLALMVGCVKGE